MGRYPEWLSSFNRANAEKLPAFGESSACIFILKVKLGRSLRTDAGRRIGSNRLCHVRSLVERAAEGQ